MRVLAVGNMYPPHHLGGYELVWRSAMEHLRAAGADVTVLTTDHRLPGVDDGAEPGVHRELRWWWRDHSWPRFSLRQRIAVERHNARVLDRTLAAARPEVVAWWAMGGMSLSLIEGVRRRGLPAVGFVHDEWMLYGPRVDAGRRIPFAKRVDLGSSARWLFVSEHVRKRAAEVAGTNTGVAHSGVDDVFLDPESERPWRWRLLYAGRLDPRKGLATAVEALGHLPEEAVLVVAGAGDPGELAANERVELLGALDRVALRAAYADADAVLFPVNWDEPWGLVPLEAMAVGRPVVATLKGGATEYLRPWENCLSFDAGSAVQLAGAVRRLASDADLRATLRAAGRATAERHTARAFNERVEQELAAAISA